MAARPLAFGIDTAECDGNDLGEALLALEAAAGRVRTSGRPFCQILHTYRMGPHSRGDDFRDPAEVEGWRLRDPLLLARRTLPDTLVESIEAEERAKVQACFERLGRPEDGGYVLPPISVVTEPEPGNDPGWLEPGGELGGAALLRQTFATLMEMEPRMHLVGEDILDPSGGAFTLYRGLSTRWPKRVHSTPISEAAIAGLANGMALRGLRPVVEFMFGDFLALIMDQILNQSTKYAAMYAGKAHCPVILRTPVGGYRGYGPTHSQSPEKHFMGMPGLTVTALSPVHDPLLLWRRMMAMDGPCLHVEGKLLYSQPFRPLVDGRIDGFLAQSDRRAFPTIALQLVESAEPDLIVAVYGELVPLALDVARQLFMKYEKVARVVVPSCLSPMPTAAVAEFAGGCRALLTIEEGSTLLGWGSGLVAELMSKLPAGLRAARLGALNTIIPASAAGEAAVLPGLERGMAAALEVMRER
jgi:2-oxoisovalerate dehydrogenase E1 component